MKKNSIKPTNANRKLCSALKRPNGLSNHLALLKRYIESDARGSRNRLVLRLTSAFRAAQVTRTDADLLSTFLEDPRWDDAKARPQAADDVLHFMLTELYGTREGSNHKNSLKGFWEADVPADDLPDLIKSAPGGLRNKNAASAKPKKIGFWVACDEAELAIVKQARSLNLELDRSDGETGAGGYFVRRLEDTSWPDDGIDDESD